MGNERKWLYAELAVQKFVKADEETVIEFPGDPQAIIKAAMKYGLKIGDLRDMTGIRYCTLYRNLKRGNGWKVHRSQLAGKLLADLWRHDPETTSKILREVGGTVYQAEPLIGIDTD